MVDFESPKIKVALTEKKPQVHGEAKLRGKGPSPFFSVTAFTVCRTNIIEYCP